VPSWYTCISAALPSIARDYTNDCKETLLQQFLLKLVKPNIGRSIESSWDNHHKLCGQKRVFQWQTAGIGHVDNRRTRIKTEITSVMFKDFKNTPSRCRLKLLLPPCSTDSDDKQGFVPPVSLPDRVRKNGTIETDYALVANPQKNSAPEFVEVLVEEGISKFPVRILYFKDVKIMLYAKDTGECGYGLFFRVLRKGEGVESSHWDPGEEKVYLDLGCYASSKQAIPEHVFEIKDLLRKQTGSYAWEAAAAPEEEEVNGRQLKFLVGKCSVVCF
jgi:hypothetical protein